MIHTLNALVVSSILSITLMGPTLAQTILPEIQTTGVLNVGLRTDAPPISFRNANGELTGYCVDAIALLQDQLQQKFDKPTIVHIYPSTVSNRFDLVANGIVHVECGPNTIRDDLDSVTFSSPFFITGTHFLVNTQYRQNLDYQGDLEEMTIGIIGETTTERLITRRYPQANLRVFKGKTGQFRGIEALDGQIDTFASDGILMLGEIVTEGGSLSQYRLVPERPISCDYYGMILPQNDPEWQGFVNSVINSLESESIWQQWFDVNFPYIKLDEEFCQQN